MNVSDVYGWGALALLLGPVAAAAAIPFLKWLMQDSLRMVGLLALIGLVYWWMHRQV